MTNGPVRTQYLNDTIDLYARIASGELPAVSLVKPSGFVDGHPASSKLDLFEGFIKKIVDGVKANPALARDTAIMITVDEGGGCYDVGYVQRLDFFGDGTQIPMIIVSQNSPGRPHRALIHRPCLGHKVHRGQLGLEPDHKPQQGQFSEPDLHGWPDPYVPTNRPAIGDLMDMFNFGVPHP